MLYRWLEISKVPRKPGVYAWYFSPEITDYDLDMAISQIKVLKKEKSLPAALELVREFLNNNIFRYYLEEPYQAMLRGSLKPKYEGSLEHKLTLSESLVKRVVDQPERLLTIKTVIEKSAPYFSSPLYIGMSNKLGDRLNHHKRLIEKYCSSSRFDFEEKPLDGEEEDRDHSFAWEISRRNLIPNRLFVVIQILENEKAKEYIDIENILNRIHYPLLGRN